MNKTIIYGLIALAIISVVAAIEPLPKGRCDVIRPATEYREEKVFPQIGVWGRLSDGSITCFAPGSKPKHKETPVVIETIKEPEPEPTCHEECECTNYDWVIEKVWKQTCGWKHRHWHCDYGWVWEWNKICTHQECQEICE